MLLQLNVKNFALIDALDLNFEAGFTIFTGETGAGKSILIDSINFVLGEKFNKEFIRTGAESTSVEAVFTTDPAAERILEKLGIPVEEVIIFSRESFVNGRNSARINGKTVLVSVLKEVGKELLDIHGQHNNQNLLDNTKHMEYLDSFADLFQSPEAMAYTQEYDHLRTLKERLQELQGSKDREKLLDYLRFQLEDLDKAKLKVEEESELLARVSMLSHAEKISLGLSSAHELLAQESGILESLAAALHGLKGIEKVYPQVKPSLENLEGAYFALEETSRELGGAMENVYYDQDELNEVNERLYTYSTMKKKYGPEVTDVLAYGEKIRKQYEDLVNAEELIQATEKAMAESRRKLFVLGKALHELRVAGAKALSQKINRELKFVGLEKAEFDVAVTATETLHATGIDDVAFLISTNTGEPRKALEKIVSGGELSRIMLSMKVAFIDKDKTPSVIFDEIDTGISGRIAEAVGEKMYALSGAFQVFCVTHLPQIAAFSDHHLVVAKEEDKKRTFTRVVSVDLEGKVEELAKMIGGRAISEPTRQNARDIIEKTQDIKKKYRV